MMQSVNPLRLSMLLACLAYALTGECRTPVPCPERSPAPACADKSLSILPRIGLLNQTTRETTRPMVMHGAGGDRHEIGLFTEWQSEFLANGKHRDLIIAQADSVLNAPWCDYAAMTQPFWKTPKGKYSLAFTHTPNLFFIPYLLTRDKKYIAPMECQYETFHQVFPPHDIEGAPLPWVTGRDLAWQLRNLGELAYLQKLGVTKKKIYVEALELTRRKLIANMSKPIEKEFHVLGKNQFSNSDLWSGWFEGFIGQTINHIVQLGFDDWLPIAQWHFQHLLWRCGGKWPMKACDNDHVIPNGTWEATDPFNETRMPIYRTLPNDQLAPIKVGDQFMTYDDRAQNARGWAALAASNCIPGARELAEKLQGLIDRRGGERWYKFHFEVMPCDTR
jgi:hypothetical protein